MNQLLVNEIFWKSVKCHESVAKEVNTDPIFIATVVYKSKYNNQLSWIYQYNWIR